MTVTVHCPKCGAPVQARVNRWRNAAYIDPACGCELTADEESTVRYAALLQAELHRTPVHVGDRGRRPAPLVPEDALFSPFEAGRLP